MHFVNFLKLQISAIVVILCLMRINIAQTCPYSFYLFSETLLDVEKAQAFSLLPQQQHCQPLPWKRFKLNILLHMDCFPQMGKTILVKSNIPRLRVQDLHHHTQM